MAPPSLPARSFGVISSQNFKLSFAGRSRNIKFVSTAPSNCVVLAIPKADVYRFGDANNRATPVFRDLEWSVKTNESWAVVGSGSGEKSAIFDMLMGHLRIHPPPPPPLGLFPFLSNANELRDPHDCVSIVSFANRRVVGGAFYDYTARYGAVREEDKITLRQSMFPETIHDLKSQTRISLNETSTDLQLFDYLVAKMGLGDLLDLPRIALSNGQTRRARILKALLAKPRLLLLDEPLTGLDVENRSTVLAILHELHTACNPHIIIGLRMHDVVPEWVTHLAIVNDGQVRTGPKAKMLEFKTQMQDATAAAAAADEVLQAPTTLGEPVVEMKNVSVTYGPRQVLKNITWTIRKGGRYHLQGANGSGKTTLLSLLTGDHPQSYTQLPSPSAAAVEGRHLRLFATPRARLATPLLHARIGLLTPELFDAFPRRHPGGLSVWEVLGTGFEGGFVSLGLHGVGVGTGARGGVLTEEERGWRVGRVWEVLGALGRYACVPASAHNPSSQFPDKPQRIPPPPGTPPPPPLLALAQTPFALLPTPSQRLVLLMRALVARHPLLLLDEVFSGMDHAMIAGVRKYLREDVRRSDKDLTSADADSRSDGGQAVVIITHLEGEVPWGEGEGVVRVVLRDGELFGAPSE
ncbi:P-loop containing nucleoside triphosphate hydrolase protein [Mycena alexandri]|uniref:P-loop containing nucleoside triphosphate hydrolase protein n=1 Tax=Mycena alexandri TaxID=1745969 RepID=A0AAD6SR99_9AGAR|nr:P-loop containing nucleoside triphosphate hydrolase protein [Mycena alexandri]